METEQVRHVRALERFRETYPLAPPPGSLAEHWSWKLGAIVRLGRADSIRDFGGMWRVDGLYLLDGARALGAAYAEMVDFRAPTDRFLYEGERLRTECGASVTMVQTDFREAALYTGLSPVAVSLLYDVLLHQDNALEVIRNVIQTTRVCICVAQPVLREELFALPCGCVNLIFYPDALKDLIRCSWWPYKLPTERFSIRHWTWGHTVSYLTSVFYGYGWERTYLEARELSSDWAYALMRFTPRAPAAEASPDTELTAAGPAGLPSRGRE